MPLLHPYIHRGYFWRYREPVAYVKSGGCSALIHLRSMPSNARDLCTA